VTGHNIERLNENLLRHAFAVQIAFQLAKRYVESEGQPFL
jgi:hypothetical protein